MMMRAAMICPAKMSEDMLDMTSVILTFFPNNVKSRSMNDGATVELRTVELKMAEVFRGGGSDGRGLGSSKVAHALHDRLLERRQKK